jgi:hypothetical protein
MSAAVETNSSEAALDFEASGHAFVGTADALRLFLRRRNRLGSAAASRGWRPPPSGRYWKISYGAEPGRKSRRPTIAAVRRAFSGGSPAPRHT